jgi:hypothetical protein
MADTADTRQAEPDPVHEELIALSGHRFLAPDKARRRLELIAKVMSVGGRKNKWLADLIGCSDSNASRLIELAQQAFPTVETL